MPQGLDKIRQINQEAAARKAAYDQGGPGVRFLTLKDGDVAKVRFLEQGNDVFFLWVHQLPRKPGQTFGDRTPCLDQDDAGVACPACERGERRSYIVIINVIWFGAPKFLRDDKGKVIKDDFNRPRVDGVEDTLAVWERGPEQADRLQYLDANYNGLTNWHFKVTRQGSGKDDTKYFIDPWDPTAGATAPSPQEQELAAKKPDPRTVKRPLSYGDLSRAYSGGGGTPAPSQGGGPSPGEPPATGPNAFENAQSGAINRGAFAP